MTPTLQLARSIEAVDAPAWDALLAGPDDLFMDRRWLRAVEYSVGPPATGFVYGMLRDGAGRPLLSAALTQTRLDPALLAWGWVGAVARRLSWLPARWTHPRCLLLGSAVHGGQSQLRIAPGAATPDLLARLAAQLDALAREMRAAFVLCGEFGPDEAAALAPMQRAGYRAGRSLPMNRFAGRFGSVDDFSASLRSHYRYKLERSRRRFARTGLTVQMLMGDAAAAAYGKAVHALILQVGQRAQFRIDPLPRAFFLELLRQLPQNVALHLVHDGATPVACAWSLFGERECRNLFVGYDATRPDEDDLYFNLMLQQLDFALTRGATTVLLGQTADEFKSRIGCTTEELRLLVRPLRADLRLGHRLLQRWLHPLPTAGSPRRLYRGGDAG